MRLVFHLWRSTQTTVRRVLLGLVDMTFEKFSLSTGLFGLLVVSWPFGSIVWTVCVTEGVHLVAVLVDLVLGVGVYHQTALFAVAAVRVALVVRTRQHS
jgi:hypothetical protein